MTAPSLLEITLMHVRVQEVTQMNDFGNIDPFWAHPAAIALLICGLVLVVRGLRGGRDGARALLGTRTDMLSRIEGFRLTVFGLVLIGVGAAVLGQAKWLLLLALGIGVVEILESSTLIAVWKWGQRTKGDVMT
jgi:hypothetical protein